MPTEIERKFLVTGDAWRKEGQGILLRQGYLNSARECTVRVRTAGDQAFLTIKGTTVGITRAEYEYAIPVAEANALLNTLAEKPIIEKIRTIIPVGSVVWEVDEFLGENKGLIVAEIELEREDAPFPRPEWLGEEVTGDPRYYNSSLVTQPYSQWKKTDS